MHEDGERAHGQVQTVPNEQDGHDGEDAQDDGKVEPQGQEARPTAKRRT